MNLVLVASSWFISEREVDGTISAWRTTTGPYHQDGWDFAYADGACRIGGGWFVAISWIASFDYTEPCNDPDHYGV